MKFIGFWNKKQTVAHVFADFFTQNLPIISCGKVLQQIHNIFVPNE